MSAKLIRTGGGRPAETVQWPTTENVLSAPRQRSIKTEQVPSDNDDELHAQLDSLRSEIEEVKADASRRVAEALAAGRREGDASARQSLEKIVEAEAGKLRQMLRDVMNAAPKLRRQAEEDLVRLAVAVARRILHREITVDADALIGLVRSAFDRLDAREIQTVRTDPGSVDLVKQVAEGLSTPRELKIVGDGALKPGSLLIETTRGELDASVETQLQEIQRGFIDVVNHS